MAGAPAAMLDHDDEAPKLSDGAGIYLVIHEDRNFCFIHISIPQHLEEYVAHSRMNKYMFNG